MGVADLVLARTLARATRPAIVQASLGILAVAVIIICARDNELFGRGS